VRLALAHAIDKAALVDGALLGFGKVGTTLIPPSLGTWHNGEVADVPFDPTKARSLLDAAGYGGTKGLQLRLLVASDFLGNQGKVAAAKIAGWLKDVGITVMVKTMSQQELDSTIFPDYDFDLVLWDWRSDPDPDFLLSVLTAEQLGHWNDAGYSNPRYDALYRQQARTIDPEARRKLVWEMQRIISDDRPYLVLFYEPTAEAYSSDTFVERPAVADGAGVLENLYWLRSVLP
jgi:ABC-type transport system substrate-binding protein